MDIQKERKAFEKALVDKCGFNPESSFSVDDKGEYKSDATHFGWAMWQAAKAQAVQEGFVLVEKTKLMQIVGSAAIIEPITRGNPLMSKYKTELDFILSTVRAMIEAQEPASD